MRRLLVLPLIVVAFGACAAVLPGEAVLLPMSAGETAPAEADDDGAGDEVPAPDGAAEEAPTPGGLDADEIFAMSSDACLEVLDVWEVPFEVPAGAPSSIESPVRLTGPVAGVTFAIPWRVTNDHDVLDCRLAVALAEWAVLLRELGVVEVRLYSFYRRGTRNGVSASARGQLSQHHFGMAIDAGWLVLESGDVLAVLGDWVAPGAGETCDGSVGDGSGRVLFDSFCGAWEAGMFHVQLSPEHNREHANHFHLDVGGGNGGRYLD